LKDIIEENPKLFKESKPEHCVIIKYIKAVGDNKRAMDEYHSKIFLDGRSNIAIHNICEDTNLSIPLIAFLNKFINFGYCLTYDSDKNLHEANSIGLYKYCI
jgi:myo-inositol-1-phosphate synthase